MDRRVGPIPVFSTSSHDKDFALKVAIKSQLVLSFSEADKIYVTDSIIPFPDLKKIAYVFLFGVRTADKTECVASLSYIVDDEQKMELCKKAPLLRRQAEKIASVLKKNFEYADGDIHVSDSLKKLIETFGNDEALKMQIDEWEDELRLKKIKLKPRTDGTISFLLETIKNNLEAAFYSMIAYEPVVVCGHKTITPLILACLEYLAPFRILKKIEFSETYVEPSEADLIGVDKSLKKYYLELLEKQGGFSVVDVEKGTVHGKVKPKFLKKIIKELRKEDSEAMLRFKVENLVKKILTSSNEIINLCASEGSHDEEIKKFKKSLEPEELDLIIKISSKYFPAVKDCIEKVSFFGKNVSGIKL